MVSRRIVLEIKVMPVRRKSPDGFESTVKQDFGEMEIKPEAAISRDFPGG
ncbi:hypothetical protein [Neorhizobium petrolearium]